ncbi:MAG: HAMP domain-containing protein [Candidatus Brocadiaceae bacterium]|nr:HAMP domain-containing protein [Candidatus Brocadiaceae bacterium]
MFKPTKITLSIAFLVLTFLPLFVLRLVVYPVTFNAIKNEIIKDLDISAQKQAELITRWMESCTSDIQRIANNPFVLASITPYNEGGEDQEVLTFLDSFDYFRHLWDEIKQKEVFIADRHGIVRFASGKSQKGKDFSTRDFFTKALSGSIFISNIRPSVESIENEKGILEEEAPTMFISVPVVNMMNRVEGVVIARLDLAVIDAMMRNLHLGKTGETYLINSDGIMLTESRFTEELKEKGYLKKRSALELKVINPKTGKLTESVRLCAQGLGGFDVNAYYDYRGVQVLGFWQWMPDYCWGLVAEIDADEAYGALYTLRNFILFTFGILAIGVVIIAFFLSKRISSSVSRISETAMEIANGRYTARIESNSDDEMGTLARAINKMGELLEKMSNKSSSINPAGKESDNPSQNTNVT